MTRRADPRTWRLYVVTDERVSRGLSHEQVAAAAFAAGAPVVQLRDKEATARRFLEVATRIRERARAAGAAFVVNDRVDVALAVDADGVHVGQADLPAGVVRRLIGDARVLGVTARDVDQALAARDAGADYVGFGPIRDARATKPDAVDPVGLGALAEVAARVDLPVIAIGGIRREDVPAVLAAGAAGVAVVSAVAAQPDPEAAARDLLAVLQAG